MAIIWTKDWEGTDDGTIIGGLDLKNIQDDLSNVLQAADSISVTEVTVTGGILAVQETTTPTALVNYGKIYTKSDNKLYFQDGAGTEHEVQFV
jgi:hypothetical protein